MSSKSEVIFCQWYKFLLALLSSSSASRLHYLNNLQISSHVTKLKLFHYTKAFQLIDTFEARMQTTL